MPNVTVVVLPAFTRSASHVSLFTRQVAEAGFHAIAIDLAPRFLPIAYMYKRHLRRIAAKFSTSNQGAEVVLVGHSAGAAAASFLALAMQSEGVHVKGVVFADGVDSPNHLIRESLKKLEGMKVAAVLAPPSPCNRQGSLEHFLVDYPWVRVTTVPGAGHGDIEGAGIPIYRRFCADNSSPQAAARFRQILINHVEWIVSSGN